MAREEGRVLTWCCEVTAAGDGRPPRVLRGVGGGDRLVALAGDGLVALAGEAPRVLRGVGDEDKLAALAGKGWGRGAEHRGGGGRARGAGRGGGAGAVLRDVGGGRRATDLLSLNSIARGRLIFSLLIPLRVLLAVS